MATSTSRVDDPAAGLAEWSPWVPFLDGCATDPRTPGVYMARDVTQVVYVGMAAERQGRGVRGRLTVYRRGRAAVSGLGEAAMDRALADPEWLRQRLEQVEAGQQWRTRDWASAALERADLQVRWASTADGAEAKALERAVLDVLAGQPLWNRTK